MRSNPLLVQVQPLQLDAGVLQKRRSFVQSAQVVRLHSPALWKFGRLSLSESRLSGEPSDSLALKTRLSLHVRPVRLVAQDSRLSTGQRAFDSRTGRCKAHVLLVG